MKSDDKTITNSGTKMGFHFGLVGDINLSKNFAFSSGILLNNLSTSLKYQDSTTFTGKWLFPGAQISYKLKYIEVPIGIKFKTNEIGYLTYFLQAGINPNIRFSATGSASQQNITDENANKDIRLMYLAYSVGGGLLYSLGTSGNTDLMCAVIFTNGITDVTTDKANVILNNLALRVGVIF